MANEILPDLLGGVQVVSLLEYERGLRQPRNAFEEDLSIKEKLAHGICPHATCYTMYNGKIRCCHCDKILECNYPC